MNESFVYQAMLDMCSVDFTGAWQPGAILRAMQNAGEGHCRKLHLSFEELREHGLAWVLSRVHVQMDKYPVFGQTVTVKTWPGKTKHMFFPRYYTFEADGREMGRASVLYVLLDMETRKIAMPVRLPVPIPEFDLPAALPFPRNIKLPEAEPSTVTYQPVYTDLDMNGHVNNTRYLDWFGNLFSFEKHRQQELSDILVHYNFEVTPHEEISFMVRQEGDACVVQGISAQQVCFAIEGTWRAHQ